MSGIQTYGNRRYIFDGFPRNKENLEEFYTQMADKVVIRNLIYFDCPSDIMIERVIGRSLISGRSDDNPETMKKRLQTF
jgi:UMP-CMP kinase